MQSYSFYAFIHMLAFYSKILNAKNGSDGACSKYVREDCSYKIWPPMKIAFSISNQRKCQELCQFFDQANYLIHINMICQ